MDRAASGLMGVSLENREGTYSISGSYQMQSFYKRGGSHATPQGSKNRRGSNFHFAPHRANHQAVVSSGKAAGCEGVEHDDASDKYIIQKTTGFDVVYSEDGQRAASQQRQSAEDPNDVAPATKCRATLLSNG